MQPNPTSIMRAVALAIAMLVPSAKSATAEPQPYQRLDTFGQILGIIEGHYVDETDRTKMIDGAIHGMVRAMDPHSSFMTGDERREFERRTAGRFVGVGIEVGIRNNELTVITAFNGSPAGLAGISSGDVILAVDGRDVSRMSLDEIVAALIGEQGTQVSLLVRHPENMAPKKYSVTRRTVQLEIVRGLLLDDDYAYVSLKTFASGSADKVRDEIKRLNSIAPNGIRGIVLDLRRNPGGFLQEGVRLANLFIKSGNIVSTKGRDPAVSHDYKASPLYHEFDLPLAVIIDEGSASASEIVAGALQDRHRAIIVGQTSFGKASVQNMFTLPDGSTLKLTVGRYYTPSGRCIQGLGITPDIEVEDLDMYIKHNRLKRERDLENSLPNPESTPRPPLAQDSGEMPAINDLQLFTALQALRARTIAMTKE